MRKIGRLMLTALLALTVLLSCGSMTAYAKTGWMDIGTATYYYDSGGNRVIDGLFEIDGKAYLFDERGRLVTKKGWYKVRTVDDTGNCDVWYYLNSDGSAYRGWKKKGGKRYYLAYEMVTKPISINGAAYVFAEDGTLVTKKGWYTRTYEDGSKNSWYISSKGTAFTGWHKISGKWYYFDSFNGLMYCGGTFRTADGKICSFRQNGVWRKPKGWQTETVTYTVNGETVTDTYYSYFGSSGYGVTGWQKLGGSWYFFSKSGMMATGWLRTGGNWYYLYENGKMATGRVKIDGITYTFSSSGALQS